MSFWPEPDKQDDEPWCRNDEPVQPEIIVVQADITEDE